MTAEAQIALYGLIVSIFALLVTAGNYLVQWHLDKERKTLERLLKEYREVAPEPSIVTKLYEDVQRLGGDKSAAEKRANDLQNDLEDEQKRGNELTNQNGLKAEEIEALKKQASGLNVTLTKATFERDDALARIATAAQEKTKESKSWQFTLQKTMQTEGRIWLRPVKANKAYQPVDLPIRKTPIVSVLNLKGGVGKTTLTAFLGLALVRLGWKVLLIDLDLQGSLTSLFFDEQQQVERDKEGRTVRGLMEACARPRPKETAGPGAPPGPRPALKDYTFPLAQLDKRASLVATTDRLAYTELNLTYEWLLKLKGKQKGQLAGGFKGGATNDVRLILRKALHRMKYLKRQFDIVLLDCPPVLSLSCVNALAASDYVLLPVTPSRKAVERVPSTLQRLREMREELNTGLDVLGIVVNRTQQAEMNSTEKDIVLGQTTAWHGQWGTPVKVFGSTVPDRIQVRDAEDDFPPRGEDSGFVQRMMALAREVVLEINPHCGPSLGPWTPATTPAAEGVIA